jgi:hypothetical protein
MDTTSFLAAVDRAITVPNYQPRFSQSDILALANEEQQSMIVPMIVALREEFFVFRETLSITAGDFGFRIPERAIGRTLREIQYRNQTGGTLVYDLPRISIEDSYRFTNLGVGTPNGFMVEGDSIRLLPTPSSNGEVILYTLRRPSDLVLTSRTAVVTAVGTNTITLSKVPSNFTIGSKIDITDSVPSFPLVYKDLTITNITGLVLTVSGFTGAALVNVDVNDVVSTALETSLVQIPSEAQVVLVHATAVRVLEALSIPDQMKIAEEKLQQKIRACREILSPRVEGSTPKVIQRDGLLRGRATVRRFPSVSVP